MYANARDGKTIPISIVYRKDMKEAQNLLCMVMSLVNARSILQLIKLSLLIGALSML